MHFAQLARRRHRRQRRVLHRGIVMLNPDQRLHAPTPISLSLATSASTSATLIPACRLGGRPGSRWPMRSEEHTSELQSLMRISYAVFCLKKKTKINTTHTALD